MLVALFFCALSLFLLAPLLGAGAAAGDLRGNASPSGPLGGSQFLPPRHELAVSAFSERRGRPGGPLGLPRVNPESSTDADRRTHKEAERAERLALLHEMWAYDRRFVNDITEGGKDAVNEVSNLKDWADAIPSVATD